MSSLGIGNLFGFMLSDLLGYFLRHTHTRKALDKCPSLGHAQKRHHDDTAKHTSNLQSDTTHCSIPNSD
jgi:hypothetical protein